MYLVILEFFFSLSMNFKLTFFFLCSLRFFFVSVPSKFDGFTKRTHKKKTRRRGFMRRCGTFLAKLNLKLARSWAGNISETSKECLILVHFFAKILEGRHFFSAHLPQRSCTSFYISFFFLQLYIKRYSLVIQFARLFGK